MSSQPPRPCQRDAGARALSRAPGLKGIVALNLAHNRIGDEGARALCESAALPNLRRLTVISWPNPFSPAVEAALKARFVDDVDSPSFR